MGDLLTYLIYTASALLFAWFLNKVSVAGRVRVGPIISVNIYLVAAFLVLVIIGSFRDVSVGKDTIQYVTLYSSPNHQAMDIALDSYFKSEPGFAMFVLIMSKISNNYTFFFSLFPA